MTEELGIDFAIDRAQSGDYYMPDSMGTGCALLDYDGDGDLDIYLVNGFRDAGGNPDTTRGANRLYRQDSIDRFTDVTEEAGVGDTGYGMGVAVGDIDNDGDVDLYIANYGPDRLYRNNGDGTFTDISDAAGISNDAWSASVGFFDFDRDGFLDMYVTNYLAFDEKQKGRDAGGRPEYPSPAGFQGVPDVLYHNNGGAESPSFTDVSAESGIAIKPGKGLGVCFTDLNGDGLLDIYVANDGVLNFAWINAGDGSFSDEALMMGIAVNGYGRPEAGMGIAAGDTDGDGDIDLLLTHLVQETNTFYRQVSPGTFEDATAAVGVGAASINQTGFGTAFFDVELDGDLDLVVANGRVLRQPAHEGTTVGEHWRPYAEPNHLFLNDGSGVFVASFDEGGDFCANLEVSRGLATGDLDNDGDIDIVVSNGNGSIRVYRNEAPRRGNWLSVRAVDPRTGSDVIGAVVTVHLGPLRIRREIMPTGSYLSSNDPRAHFGLGETSAIDELHIVWPGGLHEEFDGVEVNQQVILERGSGRHVGGD